MSLTNRNSTGRTPEGRAGIQSVEVGFGLLDALSQVGGPLMLRDLAAAASMSAAKAHRYLVSFQRLQLVVQDGDTRYDLGPACLKLGLASLARLQAIKLARARIGALVEQIGHTLALAVWGNHGPTVVHWEESAQALPVSLRLGDVMPLLSSATGRCFAAYLSTEAITPMLKDEIARARKQGRRDMPASLSDARAMLSDVRQRGAARVINTLLPGIVAFCMPVFDSNGHIALTMAALGPTDIFDAQWGGAVDRPLRAAARQLSSDLGWKG
jgi:DNA-binding IclR family transcriptional regulator